MKLEFDVEGIAAGIEWLKKVQRVTKRDWAEHAADQLLSAIDTEFENRRAFRGDEKTFNPRGQKWKKLKYPELSKSLGGIDILETMTGELRNSFYKKKISDGYWVVRSDCEYVKVHEYGAKWDTNTEGGRKQLRYLLRALRSLGLLEKEVRPKGYFQIPKRPFFWPAVKFVRKYAKHFCGVKIREELR